MYGKMYGKTSIYQTCTASSSTIGISLYLVNNIGIILVAMLMFAVAAVMVRLAIVKRQRVRDLKSAEEETVLFNGDTLSIIVSFLPSNDLQRLSLTCKRFGLPEEGELSLHDEALFRKPPPLFGDCQICELRMPYLVTGSCYMTCCGKIMCSGCRYASHHDNNGNAVDNNPKCLFCRAPYPSDEKEAIRTFKKRVEAGDARAIYYLGCHYANGTYGLPQDYTKALELWRRAAELGDASAYNNIGYAYDTGEGVITVDIKKAIRRYELGAMRGSSLARDNLGIIEKKAGNMDRALKHYTIAAEGGYEKSLRQIKWLYSNGHATKDDYTKALRLYQMYLSEIKSDQRDQAAAANDKYRYY